MPEAYLQQSPLADLGLEGRAGDDRGEAGVTLAERPFRGIVTLRGKAGDKGFATAVEGALGFALPVKANTTTGKDDTTALWLGPDEWWIVTPGDGAQMAERLAEALQGQHGAVTDVSDSRTCLHVAGPKARDLIAKGCPLDLHPRVFGPGQCAQSLLGKAGVTLHQVSDEPAYDLYVLRSFAEYLWLWLEDGAREYGLAVLRG
ncbi:MAG: hypothetical protein MI920_32390 [Kiloniellales bacterium]|nr:hypothetical protein [Kiloniellales bacterium]